jgi:hypothetical protein
MSHVEPREWSYSQQQNSVTQLNTSNPKPKEHVALPMGKVYCTAYKRNPMNMQYDMNPFMPLVYHHVDQSEFKYHDGVYAVDARAINMAIATLKKNNQNAEAATIQKSITNYRVEEWGHNFQNEESGNPDYPIPKLRQFAELVHNKTHRTQKWAAEFSNTEENIYLAVVWWVDNSMLSQTFIDPSNGDIKTGACHMHSGGKTITDVSQVNIEDAIHEIRLYLSDNVTHPHREFIGCQGVATGQGLYIVAEYIVNTGANDGCNVQQLYYRLHSRKHVYATLYKPPSKNDMVFDEINRGIVNNDRAYKELEKLRAKLEKIKSNTPLPQDSDEIKAYIGPNIETSTTEIFNASKNKTNTDTMNVTLTYYTALHQASMKKLQELLPSKNLVNMYQELTERSSNSNRGKKPEEAMYDDFNDTRKRTRIHKLLKDVVQHNKDVRDHHDHHKPLDTTYSKSRIGSFNNEVLCENVLSMFEFINGMNTKHDQLKLFTNNGNTTKQLSDKILAFMRHDLLCLTMKEYVTKMLHLFGMEPITTPTPPQYIHSEVSGIVNNGLDVQRRRTAGLEFLIKRYNINLFYARIYYSMWTKDHELGKREQFHGNSNIYPVAQLKLIFQSLASWLNIKERVGDYTHDGVLNSGVVIRSSDNRSTKEALYLESKCVYDDDISPDEQMEYCKISAQSLGCSLTAPLDEPPSSQSIFTNSSF